jgi:hypothetical protein
VAWERFLHFGELASDVHHRSVTGPHWYLPVIGVAPEALPAYLDTGTAEDVAFYQRHGFLVVTELLEPTSGVLIRGMRRDPR